MAKTRNMTFTHRSGEYWGILSKTVAGSNAWKLTLTSLQAVLSMRGTLAKGSRLEGYVSLVQVWNSWFLTSPSELQFLEDADQFRLIKTGKEDTENSDLWENGKEKIKSNTLVHVKERKISKAKYQSSFHSEKINDVLLFLT